MKISKIIIAVAFLLGLAASGMSFEGNGSNMPKGINGSGAGDGTGPIHNILGGEPVTVLGTVYEVGPYGEGLQIDKGKNDAGEAVIITVYGIGPMFYWDSMGVARPDVGDAVKVEGFTVTFSDGSTKIVAKSITIGEEIIDGEIIDGETLLLRDGDTGLPLWRRSQKNGGGIMMHEYRKGFRNQTCPAADADSEQAL